MTTSKYIKYALGEIILVVIGILIALQINNWNENRKIESEVKEVLQTMVKELDDNISFLTDEKEKFKKRADNLKTIFDQTMSDDDLRKILNYFGQNFDVKSFDNAYESLKTNRYLQRIKNKVLTDSIKHFFEYTLQNLEEYADWHDRFVVNNIDPYIIEHISIDRKGYVEVDVIKSLLKEKQFQNILTYQEGYYLEFVYDAELVIQQAEELKQMLNHYLMQLD